MILTLYKASSLKPSLNAYVENIEDYLNSLGSAGKLVINNFQYIKYDMDLTIKIDYPQSGIVEFPYTYVRFNDEAAEIQADPSRTAYYYIMNTSWVAQNTIKLGLALDTVNTFQTMYQITPASFSNKTKIHREHLDRFIKPTTYTSGMTLKRLINRDSEGGVIPQEIINNTAVTSIDNINYDWYVMFKTNENLAVNNLNNPVSTYIFASQEIITNGTALPLTFEIDDLASGTYYYFSDYDNPNAQYTYYKNGIAYNKSLDTAFSTSYPDRKVRMICFYKGENGITLVPIQTKDTMDISQTSNVIEWNTIVEEVTRIVIVTGSKYRLSQDGNYMNKGAASIANLEFSSLSASIKTINDVDRTDSRIMALLKIPYCPIDVTYANGALNLPTDWTLTDGYLKYTGSGVPTFINNDAIEIALDSYLKYTPVPAHNSNKQLEAESKLYHSDFFTVKLNYDSYDKAFQLENFNLGDYSLATTKIKADMKLTNTINSNFGFKFKYTDIGNYKDTDAYGEFLMINRNNEESTYSNDYINYIRNGYNYDQKARDMQLNQNLVNLGIQALSFGLSLGSLKTPSVNNDKIELYQKALKEFYVGDRKKRPDRPLAEEQLKAQTNAIALNLAIGYGSSAASSVGNIIWNYQTANAAMEQKKQQYLAQATSVSGSTDIDLLSWYNGNRLRLQVFQPKNEAREDLRDAFDYKGYVHEYTESPNINSRYWYNYIECEPDFNYEAIKQTWLDDYKDRFQLGVTVFHKRIINGVANWNLLRQYENWETWML